MKWMLVCYENIHSFIQKLMIILTNLFMDLFYVEFHFVVCYSINKIAFSFCYSLSS